MLIDPITGHSRLGRPVQPYRTFQKNGLTRPCDMFVWANMAQISLGWMDHMARPKFLQARVVHTAQLVEPVPRT